MITFNNVILLSGDDCWIDYGQREFYNITYICNGGSITGPTAARPGETVTFSTSVDSGWLLEYTVIDGNESSSNSFTMPAHDVIVYVFCKLDTDVDTVRFLFHGVTYDPTVSVPEEGWQGTWQRVSSSPNVWDYHCNRAEMWEFASTYSGGRLRGAPDFEILGNNFDHMNMWGFFFGGAKNLVKVHYMSLHQDPTYSYVQTNMFQDCFNLKEAHVGCDSSVKHFESMFGYCIGLDTVTIAGASNVMNVKDLFGYCNSLITAPSFNTTAVTSMHQMFNYCTALVDVPEYNTANVTDMESMFYNCCSLEEIPQFNTHNVINFDSFCQQLGTDYGFPTPALKHVPLLDTSSATDVDHMFGGCKNVEGGALALYQQMSSQANPPTAHYGAFGACGVNTTTGAAELAQIPSDWK